MKRKTLCLSFLFVSVFLFPLTVVVVDTDGTSGDYASLELALNGIPNPLTDDYTIRCQATTDVADTTTAYIDIGTATYDLLIEATSGNEALKTGWSTSRYRLSLTDTHALNVASTLTTAVIIDGLQIEAVYSSADLKNPVNLNGITNTVTVTIKNCYLRATGSSTYRGIYAPNTCTGLTTVVENCIIRTEGGQGVYFRANVAARVYNSVLRGNNSGNGVNVRDMDATVKNCAVFNWGNDFLQEGTGTTTTDYCASDDGDGDHSVAPSGSDWDNEFTAPSTGNFTLLNTGNLYGAGVGPGTDGNVPTTDIDGTSRSGTTCDIGTDEYEVAALTFTAHKDIILGFSLVLNIFGLCAVFLLIRKNRAYKRELAFFQNEDYLEAWCEINRDLK